MGCTKIYGQEAVVFLTFFKFFFTRNLDENMSCVTIDKFLSNILFALPL